MIDHLLVYSQRTKMEISFTSHTKSGGSIQWNTEEDVRFYESSIGNCAHNQWDGAAVWQDIEGGCTTPIPLTDF
jgi:hypothetical protein